MSWASTFLLMLALAQAPGPTEADPVTEAIAHLEAGRQARAIEILRPFVEKNPKDLPARFHLGLAYSLAGQDSEAVECYRVVLEAKPELFEANLNLGQLLVKLGQYAEAEPLLAKAAQERDKDARPVYLLARALAGQNRMKEAASRLAEAVALSPGDRNLELELAETYERAGMKPEAMEAWRRAQDDPAARERLALLQLEAGDAGGAAANLEVVMKESPTTAAAYALATAYLRIKQPEKSLPLAQAILEKEPGNVEVRLFHGRLLRDQKRYAEAARQFQMVAQAEPGRLEAWSELTAMLMLLGQYEPALETIERVRTLGGETAAYHYLRATMLDATKQHKPALASYRRFLELSEGKNPDEEFKARQRVRILQKAAER